MTCLIWHQRVDRMCFTESTRHTIRQKDTAEKSAWNIAADKHVLHILKINPLI